MPTSRLTKVLGEEPNLFFVFCVFIGIGALAFVASFLGKGDLTFLRIIGIVIAAIGFTGVVWCFFRYARQPRR